MSKYAPLATFLRSQTQDTVKLTFAQVDELVNGLPASAKTSHAWWANVQTESTHGWAQLWLAAGWQRSTVDLKEQTVIFRRFKPAITVIRYWLVNHEQAFNADMDGGCLWSPKLFIEGSDSQDLSHQYITVVQRGDVVMSIKGQQIKALGVAANSYIESPRLGELDPARAESGLLVKVEWTLLGQPIAVRAPLAQGGYLWMMTIELEARR
jgi:putative restriction endonuclease